MDPAEAVVDACSDLRRATIRGRRAPYKPIVLLWAIGRLWEEQGTGERLVPFETARDQVVPIFEQFGQAARSRVDPIDPLWRLQRDAGGLLWECRTERPAILRRDGIPSASTLIDVDARFGLSEVVHELLRSDRRLRVQVIHLLATQVCPPELWPELFAATGHPGFASQESLLVPISTTRTREIAMRLSRSPRFRSEVLGAYEHRCAICRASPRLGERRFGFEAAHINWVAVLTVTIHMPCTNTYLAEGVWTHNDAKSCSSAGTGLAPSAHFSVHGFSNSDRRRGDSRLTILTTGSS